MNQKFRNTIMIFITVLVFITNNSYAISLAETNLRKLADEDANNRNVGTIMLLGAGSVLTGMGIAAGTQSNKELLDLDQEFYFISGGICLGLSAANYLAPSQIEKEYQAIETSYPQDSKQREIASVITLKKLAEKGFQERMLGIGGSLIAAAYTWTKYSDKDSQIIVAGSMLLGCVQQYFTESREEQAYQRYLEEKEMNEKLNVSVQPLENGVILTGQYRF